MDSYNLGEQETRFANLIWDNAPINSTDLVKLAAEVMKWKKSTTYTMLHRLCARGIFQNQNALVTVSITREEFYGAQSRSFVAKTFGGSLPSFITAFIGGGSITDKQAEELVALINQHKRGHHDG